jgi:ketosteroid isomerase-like protein
VIRRLLVRVVVLAAAFSVAAWAEEPASPKPAPSVTLPPALDRVLRDYEKAWIAKDDAALAQLFTTDGYALPSGQPPAGGAAAIRAAYAQNAGSPLALRAIHYAESGDMAYIIGGFGGSADKPDFGKFVLVLRRGSDGVWRIAADMDNANAMPKKKEK